MIYFDNAATTKPSKMAIEKASIYNEENFFNPSALYQGGLNCAQVIKSAKQTILKTLGAVNFDLIFTSCGTESDNQAIFGVAKRGVFVTSEGEHAAVYKSFIELKNKGVQTVFIKLNKDGTVNTDELFELVKNNSVTFVSIMHVNNETGGINDINFIAKKLKSIDKNIIFHSDGVQAYGKIPYRISNDVDLYSISAHKINGLKGVGALIRRKGINLAPIILGGGQELGLRSGTENVFGISVFENVSLEHYTYLKDNYQKVLDIKNYFISGLDKNIYSIISSESSSPYILSISAKGLRGEVIMHSLEQYGVIVGNGSACSSKNRYSRVIKACGIDSTLLDGVIRISFSYENTLEQAIEAVKIINQVGIKLKGMME